MAFLRGSRDKLQHDRKSTEPARRGFGSWMAKASTSERERPLRRSRCSTIRASRSTAARPGDSPRKRNSQSAWRSSLTSSAEARWPEQPDVYSPSVRRWWPSAEGLSLSLRSVESRDPARRNRGYPLSLPLVAIWDSDGRPPRGSSPAQDQATIWRPEDV